MGHNFFSTIGYGSPKGLVQQDGSSMNINGLEADYSLGGIDLNEQLIRNRPATFFMRVNSDAMTGAGICKGDVVIVDRSLEVESGKIIIAMVDGEMLLRKLEVHNNKKRLLSINHKLTTLEVDDSRFSSWGVVTYVIRRV